MTSAPRTGPGSASSGDERPRRSTRTPAERRFRSTITALITALALLCSALVAVSALRGPRLEDAQADARALIEQAGQLRLFADERVSQISPDQVRVSPAADFTVSTSDDVIAVQFETPLDYGTRYSVEVSGVTSVYGDRESTFRHDFTTADAELLHLDRADPATEAGEPDRIERTNLNGGAASVVYSAPGIHAFTTIGSLLALASADADGSSVISLVDPENPERVERLLMPGPGVVRRIESGDPGGYLLFSHDAADDGVDEDLLYTVDLTGDHVPTPVPGLDGTPLAVEEWLVSPDGDRAVARADSGSVLLVDLVAAGAPPLPLGEYSALSSISLDGSAVVVEDLYGLIALSLEDGSERRLRNSPVDGAAPFGGDVRLLSVDPVVGDPADEDLAGESPAEGDFANLPRVQQIASVDPTTGAFDSSLVYDDGLAARALYRSADQQDSVETFSVSPNGLYVAVTITPRLQASVPDGYPVDPQATTVTTSIVDIRTGTRIGVVDGFGVVW